MQGIPLRRVRRQLTREAGAKWQPLPTFTRPGIGRNERRKLIGSAKRVTKHLATCNRKRYRHLPSESQRFEWERQRAQTAMPAHEAERLAAAFAWLFEIPEIHAMAASE